jgi:hypothetical protein
VPWRKWKSALASRPTAGAPSVMGSSINGGSRLRGGEDLRHAGSWALVGIVPYRGTPSFAENAMGLLDLTPSSPFLAGSI